MKQTTSVDIAVQGTAFGNYDSYVQIPLPGPVIQGLSPTSGPVGTSVTISGTGFGSSQGSSTVIFNGTAASPTSWSDSSIVAPVPSGATTGNVVVTVGGTTSNGVSFTVTVAPSISGLSPTSGQVGTSVTISGSNFGTSQGASTVTFNGTTATPTSWSDTSIVVPVPSGASTGNVVVTVSGTASNGVSFTVTMAPSISGLSPTSGPVGTSVTISGTSFGSTQGSSTVTFNGTTASPTSWSDTSIVAPVPSGATTGNVVVTVGGLASNSVSFAVVLPAPTVTAISPSGASNGGPVSITSITGTNFSLGWDKENGLVGNWRMDEASGSSVADSSGNGNTGTASGTTIVSGQIGNARSFDGASNITIPDSAGLETTDAFSVGLWLNVSSTSPSFQYVVDKWTYTAGDYRSWAMDLGTACGTLTSSLEWRASVDGTDAGTQCVAINDPSQYVNKWAYVVGTYDGTNLNLYIDGVLATSTALSSVISTNQPLYIGAGDSGAAYPLYGTVDEVRFYNRALSASEVSQLYAATQAPYVSLTQAGQSDIVASSSNAFILNSSSSLTNGTFDVTGAATGTWNVVVTDPDGQTATLANGFTVTPPSAPISYVQSARNDGSASSMSVSFGSSNTAGDLIVVAVFWRDTATVSSVTDSNGNTYASATAATYESDLHADEQIFYAQDINGGSNTVTVDMSASQSMQVEVAEYAGVATSGALDVSAANSGYQGTPDSGSQAISTANELIFSAGLMSVSISAGSGFTSRITNYGAWYDGIEDKDVSSVGSYSGTWAGNGDFWIVQMAAFKGSGGAPSDTTPPSPNPMTWSTQPNALSTSSISMTATTATDSSAPVSYLFTYSSSCSADNGTGGSSSTWQAGTSYTDTGLQVNQCYAYTVTAEDSATPPNAGSPSATSTAYTLANTPGAPTISNPSTSTLLLTNDANGNPSNTGYYVQVTSTSPTDGNWQGMYVDSSGNPSATPVLLTGLTTKTVQGLQPDTTYAFTVQAQNGDSLTTAWSPTGSGTTAAPGPSITSLSSTSGPVGTSVTITGTSFGSTQGASTVTFNGTTATPTSWSDTSIVVPVPSGATTGNVVVTVGGVASNGVNFTVTVPPSISGLSPTSGQVGTSVTINGADFGSSQGSSTVTFNGTTATPTSWSDTSIVAPVPSGATSGNVVVTVGGVASNGVSFSVTPNITSLSPRSGPVGASVTISGTSFGSTQGSSTVTFNGTTATPTSWGDTSIVAPVPSGATTGNVVVTVGGTASNGVNFLVTSPPTVTAISPASAPNSAPVSINSVTGTNFSLGWDKENGLVGNWRLDEASGSSVADSSGNGNTGTASGTTIVSGQIGNARSFNGASDYIDIPDNAAFDVTNNILSIAAWVKRASPDATGTIVNKGVGGVGGYTLAIGVAPCSTNQAKVTKYGVVDLCVGDIPADTNWHHLVAVWSGSGVTVYVDGVPNGTSSDTSNFIASTSDLRIGSYYDGTLGFLGSIDEVRVYNRALSASEVSQLYAATQDPYVSLTQTGQSSITALGSDAFTLSSGTSLTSGLFDVTGAAAGAWNVVVTDPDGQTGTLANGFTVTPLPAPTITGISPASAPNIAPVSINSVTGTNFSLGWDKENGLVGNWRMDESSGSSASDSSGNGNTGTASGTTIVSGQIGNARSFNGTSDYINMPSSSFPSSNVWSVALWFKTTSDGTLISGQTAAVGGTPTTYDPMLYVETTGKLHAGVYGGGFPNLESASAVNNGYWHQAVLTVDTSSITQTLYLDGVLVGSYTSASTLEGPWAYIYTGTGYTSGWTNANGSWFYFNGTIDEVRVYNRALSASEVSQLYAATQDPYVSLTMTGQSDIVASGGNAFTLGSSTSLTGGIFDVVGAATGMWNVVVTDPDGQTAALANAFMVTPPPPSITGLNPTSGQVGTSVTISGTNFGSTQGSSTVTFNGTAATPTSWSDTSIVAPVPSGGTTGNVVVTVGGAASNGVSFTVTVAPSISGLSPTSGQVGTSVTISGTNFGSSQGSSTVTFNGTTGSPTSWSDTSIVAPVPSGATTGNVVVTVGGLASNGVSFTVTVPPNISGLNPTSGQVGTSVTISGTNFGSSQGSSTVTFNGTTGSPTSWGDTSIVAPVPSGGTTGNVVVTVGGAASNGVSFTVTVPPNISGLSPTSGQVGTSVTISGTNFGSSQGSSTVTFNGTTTSPTSWSDTSIVAPVPSGATTGNVVVTVGGLASNGVSFTVTVAPSISTLNPASGQPGTSVTISGANFGSTQGSSTVTFNGTAASPTSWSDTSIVAPVPANATTGSVVVTVGGLASNGVDFTVGPTVYYYIQGTLGSTRMVTDFNGTPCFDADYYPYGREHDYTNSCSPAITHKFTGKEHDDESGLDNFGARYYASSYGRFTSPDPGNAGADASDPESWNAYPYTLNNPTSFTDPSGLCSWNDASDCNEQQLATIWGETATSRQLEDAIFQQQRRGVVCNTFGGCSSYTFTFYDPNAARVYDSRLPSMLKQMAADTGTGGGGGGAWSPLPQTQTPQKKPCTPLANNLQGTPAAGLDTLFDAFSRVTHPLDMLAVNATMFVAAGGQIVAGGLVIGGGCLEPTPFEPLTCIAGGAAGTVSIASGTASGAFGVYFFKNYTLPAIKDWGCHE